MTSITNTDYIPECRMTMLVWRPFSRTTLVSQYKNVSILDFIGAKDDRGGGDNFTRTIRRAKLQSDHHHQQTNTPHFYKPDAIPVTQPTASEHWRKNIPECRFFLAGKSELSSHFWWTDKLSSLVITFYHHHHHYNHKTWRPVRQKLQQLVFPQAAGLPVPA